MEAFPMSESELDKAAKKLNVSPSTLKNFAIYNPIGIKWPMRVLRLSRNHTQGTRTSAASVTFTSRSVYFPKPERSRPMKHYEDHPLAGIFQMVSDIDIAVLADDIEKNGQHEPIVLLGGKILDGRTRYRACLLKGMVPRVEDFWKNGDALAYVISKNVHRRHLDASQRAMVAARIVKEKQANSPKNNANPANLRTPDAAELMNVSERSVQSASKVLDEGSADLVKAVDSGKATVSAAATVTDLPKKDQSEAVKSGTVAAKAKELKDRPRCELCKRKGLFRDDCSECNDLRRPNRNGKPEKPPAFGLNQDADDPPEALHATHFFKELLALVPRLARMMTQAVRKEWPGGEVPMQSQKLRQYLEANALLDYPGKDRPPIFIPLKGIVKLLDLAGQVGPTLSDERIRKLYAEACGGKPFIPLLHAKKRAKKGGRR